MSSRERRLTRAKVVLGNDTMTPESAWKEGRLKG
jgi:hypothetical protein